MKKVVLFDIDHTIFNSPLFKESNLVTYESYAEAKEVIDCVKIFADVGVFSEGELEFQTKKLIETRLHKLFPKENIYIFDKKLDHLEEVFPQSSDSDVYLIDDRQLILSNVKKHNSRVHTIWIKRGKYDEEVIEGFLPDHTVTNLRDILEYIKKDSNNKHQASM